MATSEKLRGSFGSLVDTLTRKFDPGMNMEALERLLGLMGFAAATARRTAAWNRLVPVSSGFDPVISNLDDASHAIVVAKAKPALLAALDKAQRALEALNLLLDDAPS